MRTEAGPEVENRRKQQDKEDERMARDLGQQMDRCKKVIDELERDIYTLIRSQEYYRKKMRRLGIKRDRYLNLRLL